MALSAIVHHPDDNPIDREGCPEKRYQKPSEGASSFHSLGVSSSADPVLGVMTRHDYVLVMKSVKIAELKAKLSEHLRAVRRGHSVIVVDRETPIARLVPYSPDAEGLTIRKPLRRRRSIQSVPLPKPLKLDIDIVDLLLEERQGER